MTQAAARLPWIAYAGWFLAAMSFFFAWILRVSPSVMVTPLMAEFAVGGAVMGTLSGLYFYTYALLQAPAGMAMDRWGPRRVLTGAALVTALGCLVFALGPSIEYAYAGRLAVGAGAGVAFLGSLVLASNWFPARRFALYSGLGMGIGLLGGIAGQAPMALLVDAAGWRNAKLALGIAALLLALITWLLVRDRPADAPARAAAAPGTVWREFWRALRRRQTLLIACFAGLMSSPMLAFGALWGVPYTIEAYGLTKAEAASVMAPMLFGWTAGAPFWGWLSDRVRRRKVPMYGGALMGLVAVAAAIYLPVPLALYTVILFFVGAGGAAMSVCYATVREHNAGGATGAALGIVNTLAVLGGAIFQPLVGLLLDLRWDGRLVDGARLYPVAAYRDAFLMLPAIFALALLVAWRVRETRCQPIAAG